MVVEEADKDDMENSRMICWERFRSVKSEGARREFWRLKIRLMRPKCSPSSPGPDADSSARILISVREARIRALWSSFWPEAGALPPPTSAI